MLSWAVLPRNMPSKNTTDQRFPSTVKKYFELDKKILFKFISKYNFLSLKFILQIKKIFNSQNMRLM